MIPIETVIQICAETAHEVNRIYCRVRGDLSQVAWADAPEWQRVSCIKGVRGVLTGNGPEASHASWLAEKQADGWKYGPVKNVETKEHPCFVPYDQLTAADKNKDYMFVTTVRMMATSLGYMTPAHVIISGSVTV